MALSAYVDDSGSDSTSPIYVLGGVILPAEWWVGVSDSWRGVLEATPRIDYFKGSEVGDRTKGPFKDFTGKQRQQKVEALVDVLCDKHPLALSVALEWKVFEEFKRIHNPTPGRDDPYFFLYDGIIALAAMYGKRESNPTPVDFVFDNQGKIGESVHEWYQFFAEHLPPDMRSFLGKDPGFCDEKKCIPLQTADLFAWYGRRSALNTLNQDWDWQRRAWEGLSRYHTSSTMGMDEIITMARDFGIIQK